MNTLRTWLLNLKNFVYAVLARIEESSLFERAVIRWENLDPKTQTQLRTAANLASWVVLIGLITFPLLYARSLKSSLKGARALVQEMSSSGDEASTMIRPAPSPTGWIFYPIQTMDELESSLDLFLGSIGISEDAAKRTRNSDLITYDISSVSLRQIQAFIFQIDGWYPALKFTQLHISVNSESKILVDSKLSFTYDATAARNLQNRANSTLGMGMPDDVSDNEIRGILDNEPSEFSRAPRPTGVGESPSPGLPNIPRNDSFDEYPSDMESPPNFDEDPMIPPPPPPLPSMDEEM